MFFYFLRFFLFLIPVWILFWAVPGRFRWAVLLLSSYAFYCTTGMQAVDLLLAISLSSYIFGLLMQKMEDRWKTALLATAVVFHIILLALFKYPLIQAIREFKPHFLENVSLALPIGISFYIFQSISYIVDVRMGRIAAEKNLGIHLLYLSFFPKLLQGPIERGSDLLPQLKAKAEFDYRQASEGFKLILIGLFKKMVVADRLAFLVDPVFNHVAGHAGISLVVAIYAYTIQIYFDFSGYTDIARGVGKQFGINLSENFNNPYSAVTIQDFWRRWHMTLSFWLRDYLFIPLMLTRLRNLGSLGIILAAMTTFFVCGLWHGATSGFVLFGLLHGIYLSVSILTLRRRDAWLESHHWNPTMITWIRRIVTFHLVAISFVFFRANSFNDAIYFFSHLLGGPGLSSAFEALSGLELFFLTISLTAFSLRARLRSCLAQDSAIAYAVLANAIIFLGVKSSATFVYFKF